MTIFLILTQTPDIWVHRAGSKLKMLSLLRTAQRGPRVCPWLLLMDPNLGSPDRVWSCPFPNSWRKIHTQPDIFRHEFGKPRSCLILSKFSQFFDGWCRLLEYFSSSPHQITADGSALKVTQERWTWTTLIGVSAAWPEVSIMTHSVRNMWMEIEDIRKSYQSVSLSCRVKNLWHRPNGS